MTRSAVLVEVEAQHIANCVPAFQGRAGRGILVTVTHLSFPRAEQYEEAMKAKGTARRIRHSFLVHRIIMTKQH